MEEKRKPRAIGLLSGGLDSAIAVKIIKDLGVDVYCINFALPWGCCSKGKAREIADQLGVSLTILQLDKEFLETIKNAKYGYGCGFNPCVDCRIYMFIRARQHMENIHADFVFTGEVLGQRPMSQLKKSMQIIERQSGLEGHLLRPLCAQLLEPTAPETDGLIDRSRLLSISGRSRKEQIAMAKKLNIQDYLQPAGGCLLTDEHFSRRMKDILDHGCEDFRETISLKWGRHFRITQDFKAIVGRDDRENENIKQYANPDDFIFEFSEKAGPTLILKGQNPNTEILETAAGLVQYYSKYRLSSPEDVVYWLVKNKDNTSSIKARVPSKNEIERIKI